MGNWTGSTATKYKISQNNTGQRETKLVQQLRKMVDIFV
jgi:hypothetical protein